jgi:hypothetical protein
MADEVASRISAISDRAIVLSRGIAILATATGGFGYLIGLLVLPASWRLIWFFFGIVCLVPAAAVWVAHRRLIILRRAIPDVTDELRSIAADRKIRVALMDLLDRDELTDVESTPLIKLGKELLPLKAVVEERRERVANLWQSIIALTGLPGLLAIGTVGSFGLLIGSVVAVGIRLVLNHGS